MGRQETCPHRCSEEAGQEVARLDEEVGHSCCAKGSSECHETCRSESRSKKKRVEEASNS